MTNPEIDEVVNAWKAYTNNLEDWVALVAGVEPKATDCGPVYELENPIDRPGESFAIADMRTVKIGGAHYHANGEVEIYIVLAGTGRVFIGGTESDLKPGSVSITPPNVTHFIIPEGGLVLAAINTPPFSAANVVPITETDASVGFDAEQYEKVKVAASQT